MITSWWLFFATHGSMKLSSKFPVLLCLGWAICITSKVSAKTGFYPQYEYVYEYTGEVKSDLPTAGEDKTFVGIKTLVTIQPVGSDLIVQFSGINYRGTLDGPEKTPLPYSPLKTGETELKLPFKIRYETNSDVFKGIEVAQDDPSWSVNIKKAFTVFFNVRLDKHLSKRQGYFASQRSAGSFEPIDVTESGIEGTCQTKYIYQQHRWPGNPIANVLNVTKLRNITSCRDRPVWIQSINEPQKCSSCESFYETFLKHGSVATYNAYEENGNYVLQSAESKGLVHISPFPPEGDSLRIKEHQILLLKDIRGSSKRTNIPGRGIEYNIMAITPDDVNLKARYKREYKTSKTGPISKVSPLKQTLVKEEPKDKVQRIFGELNNDLEDVYRIAINDSLVSVPQIVGIMRQLTYEEIQLLYNAMEKDENKRRPFIDIITMTGTEASVMFIKYLIEQRKITGEDAAQVISSLPAYILDPQPTILEEIWPLCKSRQLTENRQVYATTLLAFGELVNQACVPKQQPKTRKPHQIKVAGCPSTLVTRYLKELISMFEQSKEVWEKSTILYTLYHMGLPETLDFLAPYFQSKILNLPISLAVEMIATLAEIGPVRQADVTKYILPIFYNTTVPTEVRLMAFEILAYTTTSQALMNQLALSTWNEPNREVSKYIYNYLKNVEDLTLPCWRPMAIRNRQARKLAKPDTVGLLDSRLRIRSFFSEKFSMGAAFGYGFYHSSKFLFPRFINVHLGTELAGHYGSAFEFFAATDGMQKLLDFTIGPKADYLGKTKYSDIFKSDPSTESVPTSTYQEEEIHVTPRVDEPFCSRLKLTYLLSRHRIFFLDDKTLDDVRHSGLLPAKKDLYSAIRDGVTINYRKLFMVEDTEIKFSSLIGLPMKVQFKKPGYVDVRGKFSAQLSKTGITNALSNIVLKPEITATVATNGWMAISTDVPFEKKSFTTAVTSKVFLTIPVNGQISIDLTQKAFKISMQKRNTVSQSPSQPIFQSSVIPKVIVMDYTKRTKVEHDIRANDIYESTSHTGFPGLGTFEVRTSGPSGKKAWKDNIFKYRNVEITQPHSMETDQVELYINWKHSPSPFEEHLWRGKSLLQRFRLWYLIPEWRDFPIRTCEDYNPSASIQATEAPKKSWFSRMRDKFSFGRSGGDDEDEDEDEKDHGRALHPHIVTGDSDSDTSAASGRSTHGGYGDFSQTSQVSGQDFSQTQHGFGPGHSQSGSGYEPERLRGKKSSVYNLNFKDEQSTTLIAVKFTTTGAIKQQINADITITRNIPQGIEKATVVADYTITRHNRQSTTKVCISADHYDYFNQCKKRDQTTPVFDYKLYWGPACTNNNYLLVKAIAGKEPGSPDDHLFQKRCGDEIKKGFAMSEDCMKLFEKSNLFTKLRYEIQFTKPNPILDIWTNMIDRSLQCHPSEYVTINQNVKNEEGKILLYYKFHLDEPLLDIKIQKANEDIQWKNIYYPDLGPLVFPASSLKSYEYQLGNVLTDNKLNTQCILTTESIRTFNQIRFNYTFMEIDACPYVLAMDCSPSKLFRVIVAGKPHKKLRVEILGHTIELSTVQTSKNKVEFLVDGKPNFIEEGQTAVIRSMENEDHFLAYVAQTATGIITIKSPPLGLWVTGSLRGDVKVVVSEFWKGKVCGLCGEDNETPHHTLLGADQCLYGEPTAFFISYRLNTPQCRQSRPISSYNINKPQCLPMAPSNLEKLTTDGDRRPSCLYPPCPGTEPSRPSCPYPPCRDTGFGGGHHSQISQTTGDLNTGDAGFESQISQTSGGFPDTEGLYGPDMSQTSGGFHRGPQHPTEPRRHVEPGYGK